MGLYETETIAVIGSFKNHLEPIRAAVRQFTAVGLQVTSPRDLPVIDPSIDFVRFDTDPAEWDDPMVQIVALHRILRADLTYVIAPGGYVGRTTCYEIGRVIQAQRPIYFSAQPQDLPVAIPAAFVMDPSQLMNHLSQQRPRLLFQEGDDEYSVSERALLSGDLLDL